MDPVAFSIGNIDIKWYSLLILAGIIIAFFLADFRAKKMELNKDFIFDVGFWVVVFGILGARLYYVLFNWGLYKNDLLEIFRIWNGGLAIHGGLIAGFITLFVYCKRRNVELFKITDIAVPSVIIAQAIGRWGNFFNSEAHGPITSFENLKNLKVIPDFVIEGMNIRGVYYHPTFYYEFLWCLLGFCLLLLISKLIKSLKTGQLTCIYLIWYSVGRFFIEQLRTDSLMIGPIKMAQLISLLLIVVGVIGFILFCFIKKEEKE